MKRIILLFTAGVLACTSLSHAQSADDEALKQVCDRETESFMKKDSAAWKSLFALDSLTTSAYTSSAGIQFLTGWQEMEPVYMSYFRRTTTSYPEAKWVSSRFVILSSGDLATIEYDQSLLWTPTDSAHLSHEARTMKKIKGEWKIVSLKTMSTSSYTTGDSASLEDHINAVGYHLLNARHLEAAIDIFKLNIKYSPKSWNVYDSMGEAYMKAGNKALAIKNYETSLKINPKNDNGTKMLAELKKK